ncbi:MAG: hypothetical protein RLY16_2896 [Bacteroidota bacterium]
MRERYYSIDIFRGATVALMILVNNPGNWSHLFSPLAHATWHGCTPTDLVFPFFLFAVGNALAFVLPQKQSTANISTYIKILKRSFLIFIIGLLLNWFPFVQYNDANELAFKTFNKLRIMGVLQRIAVCYLLAALLAYWCSMKQLVLIILMLLLGYWGLCVWMQPVDSFSLYGWFGNSIDLQIFGEKHLYTGEGVPFDPEGLMSSFGAIAEVLIGYLIGRHIQKTGKQIALPTGLFLAGLILILLGWAWSPIFPINKKIWTSSYTLYTAGWATCILSVFIYFLEIKKTTGFIDRFFEVFGKNALFIFVLSGALPRLLRLIRWQAPPTDTQAKHWINPMSWWYENCCAVWFTTDPRIGSLLYAISLLTLMWLIALWMHRSKIYIKV